METIVKAVGVIVLLFVAVFAISLVLAYPTMLLVNAVFAPTFLVAVFGVVKIGFWRTVGLGLVTGLLFGSRSAKS